VPVMVKPLTRRALRQPTWPLWMNRFVSAVTLPLVRITARSKPLRAEVVPLRRFGDEFTVLWDRLAPKFDFAVRRDAPYLNWKFLEPPHIRYSLVALKRADALHGYAVYRHLHEPRGRVTLLVDFLVDPDDELGVKTLLRWVDREARAADTDKIRTVCMHDGYRRIMRGRTTILISHRLDLIRSADDAVVLVGARVVESGTPAALEAAGGAFAALFGAGLPPALSTR
jgi:hypothetical protein